MYRLKQITIFLGDMICMLVGLLFAIAVRHWQIPSENLLKLIAPMSVLFIVAALIMFIAGLYDVDRNKNSKKFFNKIIITSAVWILLGVIFFYVRPYKDVTPKTILLLNAFFGFGIISLWRFFYNKLFSTIIWRQNIVFAGISNEVKELIAMIKENPQCGYKVKGLLIDETTPRDESLSNIIMGTSINEITSLTLQKPNIIVLTPAMEGKEMLLKELYSGLFKQINVMSLAQFYEEVLGRIPPFTFSEGWFISNLQEQKKRIYDRAKLIIDYSSALLMAVFFLITFPFIALAIKINSRGPIFFRQQRVGLLGKNFFLYKFRTMKALNPDGSAETNGPCFASQADRRITRIGKFLRLTRLDEIPQFINILRAEMSIIGPRPERPEFVDQTKQRMPYYSLRHLIKPGLTGWAQIKHGYSGNIDENLRKLEYDLYYLKNRGPMLDLAIILRTINIVAKLGGR
ncbi:MAG: sugar transferase [bacterium]